jgi:hypothetical protein
VHLCYFDTAPSRNAASLALLSLLTAVCPKNFDACRIAFPHARNLACFFIMHRHLLKIDDKPAWKFIALQQAGLRPGKPHHVFSMPLSDVKEHQEISDAATPLWRTAPKT